MKRKIIRIDERKCTGCGLCVPNCAEGAIQIIDGKARLVADRYCDGLGACLGHCPEGALTIEEREAEDFDEAAVEEYLRSIGGRQGTTDESASHAGAHLPAEPHAYGHDHAHGGGCPGSRVISFNRASPEQAAATELPAIQSELAHWPVQIMLVPPTAPYLKGADLLLAADCVGFAYPDFHRKLLRGRVLLVGCPKLDDASFNVEKLAEIIRRNELRSITVAHMEVPCCSGLLHIVHQAMAAAGRKVPVMDVTIGVRGELQ